MIGGQGALDGRDICRRRAEYRCDDRCKRGCARSEHHSGQHPHAAPLAAVAAPDAHDEHEQRHRHHIWHTRQRRQRSHHADESQPARRWPLKRPKGGDDYQDNHHVGKRVPAECRRFLGNQQRCKARQGYGHARQARATVEVKRARRRHYQYPCDGKVAHGEQTPAHDAAPHMAECGKKPSGRSLGRIPREQYLIRLVGIVDTVM